MSAGLLAGVVLAAHLAVIAFNVFGLVAIPLGAWRRWSFVRARGWRLLHLASLAVVAAQALLGRACFLTIWQDDLAGGEAGEPLVMRLVNRLVYWPLPAWVFTAAYVAVFVYVVALWLAVPPRPSRRPSSGRR